MRQQRSGHIINISSVAGLIGAPGQGFYSASKFALEGYSEALSVELDPFNIKVSLIEPGYFKTNFNHAMLPPTFNYADYDNVRDVIGSSVSRARDTGKPLKSLEDAIAEQQYTLSLIPEMETIYFCPDRKGYKCFKVDRNNAEKIEDNTEAETHFYAISSAYDENYSTPLTRKFRKPGAGRFIGLRVILKLI